MTINLKKSDSWKIQLSIAINFICFKDVNKKCALHSKSDNIEFMAYDNANETVHELSDSLLSKDQIGLETSMRGSIKSFELLYYKCHKTNFKRGGSYIDYLDWLKTRKATINPRNIVDKCFQYAVTVTLNYEEIKWNAEIVSNIKPFINNCNWKAINDP